MSDAAARPDGPPAFLRDLGVSDERMADVERFIGSIGRIAEKY